MNSRLLTIVLLVGLVLAVTVFFFSYSQNVRLPGNHQGYEPVQPVAYSHRLHAGELAIPCLHCHVGAEKSKHAGIPPVNTCMNCHRIVTAAYVNVKAEDEAATKESRKPRPLMSSELQKLYDAMGLDAQMHRDAAKKLTPIRWMKVHNLPDFVYFDHRPHVGAGVDCAVCHGAVETMERVRQVSDLTMGWCVNCHRNVNATGLNNKPMRAPTDCSGCHY